jgi:hypothetical protein
MKFTSAAGALLVLLTQFAVPTASADQTYLSATFDGKTVGQPLSMGGASVGEPVGIDATVADTVRATPFSTPCLEIQNIVPTGGGYVYYKFLGDATITSGLAVIRMDLWFPPTAPSNGYWMQFFPRNDWTHAFLRLLFTYTHQLQVMDYDGYSGGSDWFGSYPAGRAFPLMIVFDMNAGTYSIWIDDAPIVTNEAHGVTGFGLSQFMFGMGGNSQYAKFWMDSVEVTDYIPDVPVRQTTWGGVKAAFRK